MTRKISGHDGELVVNDAVELDGQVTGGLVIEPGGSAVVQGSLVGPTLSVSGHGDGAAQDSDTRDDDTRDQSPRHHDLDGELGSVISDIP